eukprot:965394-Amphidinium_carterae.2
MARLQQWNRDCILCARVFIVYVQVQHHPNEQGTRKRCKRKDLRWYANEGHHQRPLRGQGHRDSGAEDAHGLSLKGL